MYFAAHSAHWVLIISTWYKIESIKRNIVIVIQSYVSLPKSYTYTQIHNLVWLIIHMIKFGKSHKRKWVWILRINHNKTAAKWKFCGHNEISLNVLSANFSLSETSFSVLLWIKSVEKWIWGNFQSWCSLKWGKKWMCFWHPVVISWEQLDLNWDRKSLHYPKYWI